VTRHTVTALLVLATLGITAAGTISAAAARRASQTVDSLVLPAQWRGEWGPFNPLISRTLQEDQCKLIECQVKRDGELWVATFQGECGRPYKITVDMQGRDVGQAVLFRGTADLGEEDGGVFEWIGRATDDQFVGFYTAGRYSGVFHMRPVR
jgi:hypothetical protein